MNEKEKNKKDMKEVRQSLCDLSVEVDSIAMIVLGLSNQLDSDKTDTLTVSSLQTALCGISNYLVRISNDLSKL